jgi:hypothetical protein
MNTFDHERLDVYRVAIEFAAIVSMLTRMAKSGTGTGTGTKTTSLVHSADYIP